MQLSDDQIQQLFRFTEKKLVRWYDLQIELVDHLASRIEEVMEADKTISFDKALQYVYKEFGLFGFAKVVQEKQAQLHQAARKIWWQEVKSFFTWPRIVLFSLVFAVLWQLSQVVDTALLMTVFTITYFFAKLLWIWYAFRYKKARRKLLVLQYGAAYFPTAALVFEIFVIKWFEQVSSLEFCLYAMIGIVVQVASFRVYARIKEEALKQYPQVFA